MNDILKIPGSSLFKLSGTICMLVSIVGTINLFTKKIIKCLASRNMNGMLLENDTDDIINLTSIMFTGLTCSLIGKINE